MHRWRAPGNPRQGAQGGGRLQAAAYGCRRRHRVWCLPSVCAGEGGKHAGGRAGRPVGDDGGSRWWPSLPSAGAAIAQGAAKAARASPTDIHKRGRGHLQRPAALKVWPGGRSVVPGPRSAETSRAVGKAAASGQHTRATSSASGGVPGAAGGYGGSAAHARRGAAGVIRQGDPAGGVHRLAGPGNSDDRRAQRPGRCGGAYGAADAIRFGAFHQSPRAGGGQHGGSGWSGRSGTMAGVEVVAELASAGGRRCSELRRRPAPRADTQARPAGGTCSGRAALKGGQGSVRWSRTTVGGASPPSGKLRARAPQHRATSFGLVVSWAAGGYGGSGGARRRWGAAVTRCRVPGSGLT
ncbi:uncharacterized protein LOC109728514 [Ananas comosus]|uniref:Uncharacterized protein LOC109728514 n=1 Tax=Ananas comosus TaxID=4615 RepID=A0A6P5HMF2_ANACO|nr:uncharacterized protein LOC109728514 [Ananas comosus]